LDPAWNIPSVLTSQVQMLHHIKVFFPLWAARFHSNSLRNSKDDLTEFYIIFRSFSSIAGITRNDWKYVYTFQGQKQLLSKQSSKNQLALCLVSPLHHLHPWSKSPCSISLCLTNTWNTSSLPLARWSCFHSCRDARM
jgi:hypothetical protein